MMIYNSIIFVSILLLGSCQAQPRVIGTHVHPAVPGQFPWQVRLISYNSTGKPLYCTGVLIHPLFVLTAAQCIYEEVNVVRLNSTYSSSCDKDDYKVIGKEHIIHPDYSTKDGLVLNDLALIRLSHAVPTSAYVKPIRLARQYENTPEGVDVTVSGWGIRLEKGSPYLMFGETQTISNDKCKELFEAANVVPGALCTDGPISPCYGDGGSGLVQYVRREPVLVGIVAFVPKDNCYRGGPAGYMRVSYYRDWIDSVIKRYLEFK